MGNDLHWMITPKPVEEQLHGLSYSTWHFLAKLWNKEDKNDLGGIELNHSDLRQLDTIKATAKASNNKELAEDMNDLIKAIGKYDSITLSIRG